MLKTKTPSNNNQTQNTTNTSIYYSSNPDNFSESESTSLLNENSFIKQSSPFPTTHLPFNSQYPSFELTNLKNIFSIFFILFIVITTLVTFRYIPNIYQYTSQFELLAITKSTTFKYFSFFFNDQPLTIKIIITLTQTILMFLSCCLYNLFNQRMSVPEYQSKKYFNHFFITSAGMTSMLLLSNTFFYNDTIAFIKEYGIVDNPLFGLFKCSALLMCLFSLHSLNTIFTLDKDNYVNVVFKVKQIAIVVMMCTLVAYVICLMTVCVVTPNSEGERMFVGMLMVCMGVNDVLFLLAFAMFVLSYRFDIDYVYNMLNIMPDIEYFIDDSNLSANSVDMIDE